VAVLGVTVLVYKETEEPTIAKIAEGIAAGVYVFVEPVLVLIALAILVRLDSVIKTCATLFKPPFYLFLIKIKKNTGQI